MRLELVGIALGSSLTQGIHRILGHDGEDDFAVVVGAAGESRSFHITYRTHGRGQLFRASNGMLGRFHPQRGRPCGYSLRPIVTRPLAIFLVLFATFGPSWPASKLTHASPLAAKGH